MIYILAMRTFFFLNIKNFVIKEKLSAKKKFLINLFSVIGQKRS
ncbi:Hypothetical protein Minf_0479 [Methylacidiphilum infernorum V4]|uniref:Uncharacterized protein n=1 Tax=Methylacidiphilum infernorum (isolate V4) TaxID=481448 RepID=B3DZC0_METI4|nr:Hypothetical protein Minf_0479 [Methylacidiphilum infernorum V4]